MMYNTYKEYLESKFGEPVRKIPLNGGFSCPNLDGTKGRAGCTYCDNRAFSPVAASRDDIEAQLQAGIRQAGSRYRLFIGYFQPYSNTYAPVAALRKLYEPVVRHPNIVGLAIGTRADCFSPAIFDYLEELSRRTYVSVEIGVQTVHDRTLRRTNRRHLFADTAAALQELARRNIETVAHLMLGLPGETEADMLQTAETLAGMPVHGIKLHQLMIIRDTIMAKAYRAGRAEVLSLEAYARICGEMLARLHPRQIIHRLMADCTPAQGLLAPGWSAEKTRALHFIHNYLREKQIRQGARYAGGSREAGSFQRGETDRPNVEETRTC